MKKEQRIAAFILSEIIALSLAACSKLESERGAEVISNSTEVQAQLPEEIQPTEEPPEDEVQSDQAEKLSAAAQATEQGDFESAEQLFKEVSEKALEGYIPVESELEKQEDCTDLGVLNNIVKEKTQNTTVYQTAQVYYENDVLSSVTIYKYETGKAQWKQIEMQDGIPAVESSSEVEIDTTTGSRKTEKAEWIDSNGCAHVTDSTYDESGNILTASVTVEGDNIDDILIENSTSTTQYETYDNGNIKTKTQYGYDGSLSSLMEYDDSGNVTADEEYEDGICVSRQQIKFDKRGNMIHSVKCDADGNFQEEITYEYTYNDEGKTLTREAYKNGELTSKLGFTYNEKGNRTSRYYYKSLDEDPITNIIWEYSYDANGHIESKTEYNNDTNVVRKMVWSDGLLIEETNRYQDGTTSKYCYYYGNKSELPNSGGKMTYFKLPCNL